MSANTKWPDPTPEMLNDPMFNKIWNVIKTWDINVPTAYSGYCGATGNHARAIYDALRAAPQNRDVGARDIDEELQEELAVVTEASQVFTGPHREGISDAHASHILVALAKAGLLRTTPSIAVIPDGWQLVPKTPTLEMLSIFASVDFIESAFNNLPLAKQKAECDAYAKMLAVAPPLPFPDLSEIWREAFENLWDAAKEVHTLGASQGGQWSQLALALEQSSKFISASPSPVVDGAKDAPKVET